MVYCSVFPVKYTNKYNYEWSGYQTLALHYSIDISVRSKNQCHSVFFSFSSNEQFPVVRTNMNTLLSHEQLIPLKCATSSASMGFHQTFSLFTIALQYICINKIFCMIWGWSSFCSRWIVNTREYDNRKVPTDKWRIIYAVRCWLWTTQWEISTKTKHNDRNSCFSSHQTA